MPAASGTTAFCRAANVGSSLTGETGLTRTKIPDVPDIGLNDRWKLGGRVEWWKRDGESLWEVTAGVNWLPHPNFVLRPEVKYNEGDALLSLGLPQNSVIFGIDAILTF